MWFSPLPVEQRDHSGGVGEVTDCHARYDGVAEQVNDLAQDELLAGLPPPSRGPWPASKVYSGAPIRDEMVGFVEARRRNALLDPLVLAERSRQGNVQAVRRWVRRKRCRNGSSKKGAAKAAPLPCLCHPWPYLRHVACTNHDSPSPRRSWVELWLGAAVVGSRHQSITLYYAPPTVNGARRDGTVCLYSSRQRVVKTPPLSEISRNRPTSIRPAWPDLPSTRDWLDAGRQRFARMRPAG
jgi:hypothetical protein